MVNRVEIPKKTHGLHFFEDIFLEYNRQTGVLVVKENNLIIKQFEGDVARKIYLRSTDDNLHFQQMVKYKL